MEESPSGAGSHKRTRPVEAAGAADAQTRPPRLGKHCAFSPSFHRALPHHKHTQRKTRKSTGHWASWSPFSQFRTHMNFRRALFSAPSLSQGVGHGSPSGSRIAPRHGPEWPFLLATSSAQGGQSNHEIRLITSPPLALCLRQAPTTGPNGESSSPQGHGPCPTPPPCSPLAAGAEHSP